MADIYVKSGDIGAGSWVQLTDGQVRTKSGAPGAGSWLYPTFFKVKSGDIGGGSWVAADYESYPNPPTSFAINSWSYSSLSVKWGAPAAGGAPVSTYEIELRNSANSSTISSQTDSSSPSANFAVSPDTKYYVRIRSVAASGLTSPWVYIKPSIGHPQVISQRWVQKSKTVTLLAGGSATKTRMGKDDDFYNNVGPTKYPTSGSGGINIGHKLKRIYLNYTHTFSTSSLTSGTRSAVLYWNWLDAGTYSGLQLLGQGFGGTWGGTAATWVDISDVNSNGGIVWLNLDGSGWSNNSSGGYCLNLDLRVECLEYYAVQEDYVSTTEKANTYW